MTKRKSLSVEERLGPACEPNIAVGARRKGTRQRARWVFVIQLREAEKEWRRRIWSNPTSAPDC
jgi:hypothetical protein